MAFNLSKCPASFPSDIHYLTLGTREKPGEIKSAKEIISELGRDQLSYFSFWEKPFSFSELLFLGLQNRSLSVVELSGPPQYAADPSQTVHSFAFMLTGREDSARSRVGPAWDQEEL